MYFNPVFTLLSFILEKGCRKCYFDFFKGGKKVNDNLKVISFPPLLPFPNKIFFIRIVNSIICKNIIRYLCARHFGKNRVIQMVYLPEDYHKLVKERAFVVYECVDDHSEYPWNLKCKPKIIALENKLIRKADLLSVSSPYLLEKKKKDNPNHILTPNGVNFELFNSATSSNTAIPPEIASLNHPVILYTGAIMEWFDYELLKRIAEHDKSWNIVLIGPQHNSDPSLKSYRNIHALGVKKQSELPGYLKHVDVGIIPFLINDLIKGVNPLKLYEYLAAGKPVVSTALPDVVPFEKQNIVHIGRSHQEFIAHVDYLLNKNDEAIVRERVAIAKQFSWESIYSRLFTAIENRVKPA